MSVQSLQGPNGFTQGHCKVHIGGPVGTIKQYHTEIKCLQGLYISGPSNIQVDQKTKTSILGGTFGEKKVWYTSIFYKLNELVVV